MTTKKPRLTQAQRNARPILAKLKRQGLFSGNVKQPTRYGIAQAKTLAYVAKGRAAVVKVPRAVAKSYSQQYRVKGDKVIVPKAEGESVRYSTKLKEITSTREFNGRRITARKPRAINSAEDLPRGPNIRYVVPLGGGNVRLRFSNWQELVNLMAEYEQGARNRYHARYDNWWRYVEIETIGEGDDGEEE